jgi:hypothetical protein
VPRTVPFQKGRTEVVPAQFITELKYIRNVSPKTLGLYGWAFKAFEGALDSKEAVIRRVSTVTVNTYLRCINAYFNWQHQEAIVGERIRIPKLKEEQKVLSTLSPNQIATLISFKSRGGLLPPQWWESVLPVEDSRPHDGENHRAITSERPGRGPSGSS